ncbi:MAG: ATP-binding protein [Leptospira sp.]|nr:ATP-binding protein [Leptospira sp.]
MESIESQLQVARIQQKVVAMVSSHPAILSGDIKSLAQFITKTVAQLLNIERVGVWIFNDNKDELINIDIYFLSTQTHTEGAILREHEFREEFHYLVTEKYVDANDPYHDPRTKGFIEGYLKPNGITSMLDGVIRMGEELIGTLCFEHVGVKHTWEEDEIIFCSQLGDQISLAISNKKKNLVTEALLASEAKLKHLNESLESIVQERTSNLEKSHEALEVTISDLKKAQAQLVLSEKMASLGQLISGIAHEINNPIAAIQASNQNLKQTLNFSAGGRFHIDLPLFLKNEELIKLASHFLMQVKARRISYTGRERIEQRKKIQTWIDSKKCYLIRPDDLIDCGIDFQLLSEYEDLFVNNNDELLRLLTEEICVSQCISIIELAVERASKMTFALKNFTRFDEASENKMIDVIENIETVITIYQGQFKKNVTLVREFEPLPWVPGFPEELLHLWTNLIYNGLQAMKFNGEMIIRTEKDNGFVKITIEDTGSGIPSELKDRIFEPFFTTKPLGEGSGLGLDICKKIVDRHQGKIYFNSIPGKTKFIVELPCSR